MKRKDILNKVFKANRVIVGDYTLDNRQAIIDNIDRQVKEQGGTIRIENNTLYINGSNQFFMLPKLPKVMQGKLKITSSKTVFFPDGEGFEPIHGKTPKVSQLEGNTIKLIDYRGEHIATYELLQEVV